MRMMGFPNDTRVKKGPHSDRRSMVPDLETALAVDRQVENMRKAMVQEGIWKQGETRAEADERTNREVAAARSARIFAEDAERERSQGKTRTFLYLIDESAEEGEDRPARAVIIETYSNVACAKAALHLACHYEQGKECEWEVPSEVEEEFEGEEGALAAAEAFFEEEPLARVLRKTSPEPMAGCGILSWEIVYEEGVYEEGVLLT